MNDIAELDNNNTWGELSAEKFVHKRKLFLLLSVLTLTIYLFTPIESWVNTLLFTLTLTTFYCYVTGTILPRTNGSPVINGLLLIPLLGMVFINLPNSFISRSFASYSLQIPELTFKLKYIVVKLAPAFILLVLYRVRKRVRISNSFVNIKPELINPNQWLKRFTLVFLLFATVYLYSNIASDLPVISYFSRVFFYTFQWYFFWLGFWNFRLGRKLFFYVIVFLIANTLINFFAGGRYGAIVLLIIFGIGFYLSQTTRIRRIYFLQLIWIIPLAIFLTGVVGMIRQEIGRGDFDIILKGNRITQFTEAFKKATDHYFTDKSYRKTIYKETASRTKGGGALETVILSSPFETPYRGSENILNEFSAIFDIAAINTGFDKESISNARRLNIDRNLGTSAANLYGYSVTEKNSVEWPISADGYSRAGIIGVFLYYLLAILWFLLVEYLILKWLRNPIIITILFTVLVKTIYNGLESQPLYLNIRESILYLSFAIIYLVIFNIVFHVRKEIQY